MNREAGTAKSEGDPIQSVSTRRPIVVGVDGSIESALALHQAHTLAGVLNAPLEVLWAWQIPPMAYAGYPAAIDWSPSNDARRALDATARAEFGEHLPQDVSASTANGSAASVLLDASKRARMLVVGGRGHGGFTGLLLGSVSEACARHAECPVLVVRDQEIPDDPDDGGTGEQPIVVGVDGSAHSIEALQIAADLARRLDCELRVILVWKTPTFFADALMAELSWSPADDAERALNRCLNDAFGADTPQRMNASTVQGRAAEVLVEFSASARMLVVGARGRGGFANLLLGSVAEACVRHSSVTVLVTHGDAQAFVSGRSRE